MSSDVPSGVSELGRWPIQMSFARAKRFFGSLVGIDATPDSGIDYVDYYLELWDRFARGGLSEPSFLGEAADSFVDELTELLEQRDSRALSRAVFWGVIQVGMTFADGDPLTEAIRSEIGRTDESSIPRGEIFAGDLYMWWRQHRGRYADFSLLRKWERRDSSKRMIRLYEEAEKKSGQPGATDNPDDAQRLREDH